MPWTGTGTFTRTDGVRSGSTLFEQQEAAGVDIEAALMDAESNDIAIGLENCIARDGQNTVAANIDWGGFRITNIAEGTNAAHAARVGQTGGKHFWGGTSSGTAGEQTVSLSPSNVAPEVGDIVRFKAGFTSTGATNLIVNGVTFGMRFPNDSTSLSGFPGAITAGTVYEMLVTAAGARIAFLHHPMYMSQAAYNREHPVNGPMQIRNDNVDPNTALPAGVTATWVAVSSDVSTARALALRDSASVGDAEGSASETGSVPHTSQNYTVNAGGGAAVQSIDGDVTIAMAPRVRIVRMWRRSA